MSETQTFPISSWKSRLARPTLWGGLASVVLLLALTCVRYEIFAVPDAPPSSKWSESLLPETLPLQNVPVVVASKDNRDGSRTVTVANQGATALAYFGHGRSSIIWLQELEEGREWIPAGGWSGCGMGIEEFELAPGDQVELTVEFQDLRRERMLGAFAEQDTERSGFVVLASEGPGVSLNIEMLILLACTGYAAFMLWLGVRVVNRRERWAKWTAAGLAWFSILYPLAYGPAYFAVESGRLPDWAAVLIMRPFAPLLLVAQQNVSAMEFLHWYARFWVS
jgi:hypothetical protein